MDATPYNFLPLGKVSVNLFCSNGKNWLQWLLCISVQNKMCYQKKKVMANTDAFDDYLIPFCFVCFWRSNMNIPMFLPKKEGRKDKLKLVWVNRDQCASQGLIKGDKVKQYVTMKMHVLRNTHAKICKLCLVHVKSYWQT